MLDRVAFEGNKKIKDDDLNAVVESKPRGPLQRAMVQADASRIVEAYRHAGRDDVSVVPEIIDRGNDRVDLVYDDDRGREDARCGRSTSSAIRLSATGSSTRSSRPRRPRC